MGVYLSHADTAKESEEGGDEHESTKFGVSAMQGWRMFMEDAHLALPSFSTQHLPSASLYGVFDGHGGPAVSAWVSANLPPVLEAELAAVRKEIEQNSGSRKIVPGLNVEVIAACEALRRSFLKLDEMLVTPDNRELLRVVHVDRDLKRPYRTSLLERVLSTIANPDTETSESPVDQSARRLKSATDANALAANEDAAKEKAEAQEETPHAGLDSFSDQTTADTQGSESPESGPSESIHSTSAEHGDGARMEDDEIDLEGGQAAGGAAQQPAQTAENGPSARKATGGEGASKAQNEEGGGLDGRLNALHHLRSVVLKTDSPPDSPSKKNPKMTAQEEQEQSITLPTTVAVPPTTAAEEVSPVALEAAEDGSLGEDAQGGLQPYFPECCGTTAVVVLIIGGDDPMLVVANAGDSRAVLSRKGEAIALSRDHKPGLIEESTRIMRAGGRVVNGRVDGNLNLSRSIGDLTYKKVPGIPPERQKITAFPEVRVIPISPEDEFCIIACDGIWDCLSNQEAVDYVARAINNQREERGSSDEAAAPAVGMASQSKNHPKRALGALSLSKICESICDMCVSNNPLESEGGIGCDNMTIMIVTLGEKLMRSARQRRASELGAAAAAAEGGAAGDDPQGDSSRSYRESGLCEDVYRRRRDSSSDESQDYNSSADEDEDARGGGSRVGFDRRREHNNRDGDEALPHGMVIYDGMYADQRPREEGEGTIAEYTSLPVTVETPEEESLLAEDSSSDEEWTPSLMSFTRKAPNRTRGLGNNTTTAETTAGPPPSETHQVKECDAEVGSNIDDDKNDTTNQRGGASETLESKTGAGGEKTRLSSDEFPV